MAEQLHYAKLPDSVVKLNDQLLAQLQANGKALK
jgi:hypothetical protein